MSCYADSLSCPLTRLNLNRTSKTLNTVTMHFLHAIAPTRCLQSRSSQNDTLPQNETPAGIYMSLPQCIEDVHNMRARSQDVHTDL